MELFLLLIGVLFVLPLFLTVWHTVRLARLSADVSVIAERLARIEEALSKTTLPADAIATPVPDRVADEQRDAGIAAELPRVEPARAPAEPPDIAATASAAQALPVAAPAAPAAAQHDDAPSPAAPSQPVAVGEAEAPFRVPRLPTKAEWETEMAAAPPSDVLSLEGRIGGRWLLYLGVGALVLAMAWLLKFAFDNEWITPAMRVVLGGVAGLALVAVGLRFVRRGFVLYGHVLSGGGVAALYLSIYAALDFYHLISQVTAFALMTVVTAGAAVLSDRHASQGLSLAAVIGGFCTPFLVGDQGGSAWVIFGYDAILVSGTMYLARRREWPALNLVACGFTVLTMFTWAVTSWSPRERLATQVFLVIFGAMFLAILRESRGRAGVIARVTPAVLIAAVGLAHVGSVLNLWDHEPSLLVYLVALTLVGLVVSPPGKPGWRLTLWVAVILPVITLADTGAQQVGPSVLGGTLAAVYAMQQAAQLRAIASRGGPSRIEIVLLHLIGLGTVLAAAAFLSEVRLDLLPLVTATIAVETLAVAAALRGRSFDAALHYLALGATLAAIAVSQRFDGAWVQAGWITQGAGLSWLGLRTRRGWPRAVGGLVLLFSMVQITRLLGEPAPVGQMVLLNPPAITGLYLAGLLVVLAHLHERHDWTAWKPSAPAALMVGAQLVGLVVLTAEINAYWSARGAGTADSVAVSLARAASLIVAWAMAGAAPSATGLRRGYALIRLLGGMALGVAVVQLVLLLRGLEPAMPAPPPGYVVGFNARGLATAWTCATLLLLARMYRAGADALPRRGSREIAALVLAAALLCWAFLSADVNAFWQLRDPGREGYFARQLTLSMTWAAYALALVALGMWRQYAPVRYLAIGLLGVTVIKVIVVDVASLSAAYRIASAMGLGVLLLVTSYLYQRYRGESGR